MGAGVLEGEMFVVSRRGPLGDLHACQPSHIDCIYCTWVVSDDSIQGHNGWRTDGTKGTGTGLQSLECRTPYLVPSQTSFKPGFCFAVLWLRCGPCIPDFGR